MTDEGWVPAPKRREEAHLYRNRTPAKVRRNAEHAAFRVVSKAAGEIAKAHRSPRPEPVWVREVSADGMSTRSYTV